MDKNSNPNESIQQAAQTILDSPQDDILVRDKLTEIHRIFSEITSISGLDQDPELLAAVPTAYGKALGLNHAAQCLMDQRRSTKFLQGMLKAIKTIQERKPGETVKVFYAGCGPYAPFMTIIAPMFRPEELQFSLLEINEKSLESSKKLITALELEDYVMDYQLADASTFKIDSPEQYDIVFSETLDAVLYREAYVPIVLNLLPQFREDVILIPENVVLELHFIEPAAEENGPRTESHIATLLDVRRVAAEQNTDQAIPDVLLDFPLELVGMEAYESLLIDTAVVVYDDIRLYRAESSLTLPLELKLEQPFPKSRITFNYMLKPEIELKYTLEQTG